MFALLGIVARGTAFTFRYDPTHALDASYRRSSAWRATHTLSRTIVAATASGSLPVSPYGGFCQRFIDP
jgi:hypothetical protein